MQAIGSFGLVGTFVGIVALAIAFGVAIGAPILAVPLFILGFGAFLVWRGKRRADATLSRRHGARVPSTEEAAGDPVRDSGVAEATRSGSDASRRADTPGV
jgi:hypothetical protein